MIEPRRGNIAVRIIEAEEVSPGGIITPGSAKRDMLKGVVVAQGPNAIAPQTGVEIPMQTRIGDHVLWPAGVTVMVRADAGYGKERLMLMMDARIEAIVDRGRDTAPEKGEA